MAKFLLSDFAISTLATGISSGATSCTVQAGAGALFPQPNSSSGTKFLATLQSATNPNTWEVVTVTARSTDTMTMTPTVNSYSANDYFAIRNAAEMLEQLTQFDDLQTQAGNYALDTGTANAYIVGLTPSLGAYTVGLPIRVLIAHANTGASTINAGAGAESVVYPGGAELAGGELLTGGIYEFSWNGTAFVLLNPNYAPLSGVPKTGSFTATFVNGTTAPTATVNYSISGGIASLRMTAALSATLNSTGFGFSGLPTALLPAANLSCACGAVSYNGETIPAICDVTTAGQISIGATQYSSVFGSIITQGNMSAEVAGFPSGWCVTYPLI